MSAQHTPGPVSGMNNVICECCYVVHGWTRSCNCTGGPTRTDPENVFGLVSPWIDTSMGRNEATQPRRQVRPSRIYKDGIGKPVVAKRWDDIARAYEWEVVFPPSNSFGCWIVEPEAILVDKAQRWCAWMNEKILRASHAADRAAAIAKATGSAS